MSTNVTADQYLANLTRRGVRWVFYKDKADFLRHNRTAQQGFGPLKGVGLHNTAMTASRDAQLAYLYRGDGPTSSKPGPLCTGAVDFDGLLVLMGWGACTHMGPSDPKTMRLLEANALSLTGERTPVTMGTDPGTVPVNPYVLGYENLGTKLTAAQIQASILISAATLEVMGPTSEYGGGSVVMHREATYNRSDPVGVAKDGGLRRSVEALRRSWDAAAVVPPKPKPTEIVTTLSARQITANQRVTVTATVTPAVAGIVRFDYVRPGVSQWTQFGGDVKVINGKATIVSTPGYDVAYRARFYPTDKAYAIDWSPNVSLDVVRLEDYLAAEKTINDLRAQVAKLEAAAVPPEPPTA